MTTPTEPLSLEALDRLEAVAKAAGVSPWTLHARDLSYEADWRGPVDCVGLDATQNPDPARPDIFDRWEHSAFAKVVTVMEDKPYPLGHARAEHMVTFDPPTAVALIALSRRALSGGKEGPINIGDRLQLRATVVRVDRFGAPYIQLDGDEDGIPLMLTLRHVDALARLRLPAEGGGEASSGLIDMAREALTTLGITSSRLARLGVDSGLVDKTSRRLREALDAAPSPPLTLEAEKVKP